MTSKYDTKHKLVKVVLFFPVIWQVQEIILWYSINRYQCLYPYNWSDFMHVQINLQAGFTVKNIKKIMMISTYFFRFGYGIFKQKWIPQTIQIVLATMLSILTKHLILLWILFIIHFKLQRDRYKQHHVFYKTAKHCNTHQWTEPSGESKGFGLIGNTGITQSEWLKFPVVIPLFHRFWPFHATAHQVSFVLAWISKTLGQKLLTGEIGSQVVPVNSRGVGLKSVALFMAASWVAQQGWVCRSKQFPPRTWCLHYVHRIIES